MVRKTRNSLFKSSFHEILPCFGDSDSWKKPFETTNYNMLQLIPLQNSMHVGESSHRPCHISQSERNRHRVYRPAKTRKLHVQGYDRRLRLSIMSSLCIPIREGQRLGISANPLNRYTIGSYRVYSCPPATFRKHLGVDIAHHDARVNGTRS